MTDWKQRVASSAIVTPHNYGYAVVVRSGMGAEAAFAYLADFADGIDLPEREARALAELACGNFDTALALSEASQAAREGWGSPLPLFQIWDGRAAGAGRRAAVCLRGLGMEVTEESDGRWAITYSSELRHFEGREVDILASHYHGVAGWAAMSSFGRPEDDRVWRQMKALAETQPANHPVHHYVNMAWTSAVRAWTLNMWWRPGVVARFYAAPAGPIGEVVIEEGEDWAVEEPAQVLPENEDDIPFLQEEDPCPEAQWVNKDRPLQKGAAGLFRNQRGLVRWEPDPRD